jgi:aminoglycoside 2'-N-acetyltransferase I
VIELRTAHTADLDDETRAAVRALMDAAFDGVSDDTFDNVLGGVHALVVEDGELIGHASVVQRRLLHGGRALRTGYIEGVAVRSDRRRRGHGDAMMAALERIVSPGTSSVRSAPAGTARVCTLRAAGNCGAGRRRRCRLTGSAERPR